ncbi:FAD-binding protein, partial [Candidatus Bathyarchaeota archaeon]|nr:FAD-binding protein [Candidatus Bathyarchaeota archaeon]
LSSYHLEDPTSIDYPQWADTPCPPIFPNGTSIGGDPAAGEKGCTLGRYPSYVVNATGAEDIAAAVKWASQRNIRVNVKNTGHSHLGRSARVSFIDLCPFRSCWKFALTLFSV